MSRFVLSFLAAGIFAASAAFAAEGAFTSQLGMWKLNAAETKIPVGGFKPPVDELLEVTKDDGKVLEYTVHTLTPNGLVPGVKFAGAYDGKPYPSGAGPTTVSYEHLSKVSYKDVVYLIDGGTITEIGTFSDNGKKMRLEGKFAPKDSAPYDYVLIYDKVK